MVTLAVSLHHGPSLECVLPLSNPMRLYGYRAPTKMRRLVGHHKALSSPSGLAPESINMDRFVDSLRLAPRSPATSISVAQQH